MASIFQDKKAMLIKDGKPIFGTVVGVREISDKGQLMVTMETETGESVTFDAKSKLLNEEFKLISEGVYDMVTKSGRDEEPEEIKEQSDHDARLLGVRKGAIIETLILSGRYQGIWVKAQVLLVEEGTMDLKVLYPRKWKVAGTALAVPKEFIRKIDVSDKDNYTVPIKFTVDDSILYVSCTEHMRVRDLKEAVHENREFPQSQIYFIHKGKWLVDSDNIPNDVLFCIIHRAGPLTNDLVDMVESLSNKSSSSPKKGSWPSPAQLSIQQIRKPLDQRPKGLQAPVNEAPPSRILRKNSLDFTITRNGT